MCINGVHLPLYLTINIDQSRVLIKSGSEHYILIVFRYGTSPIDGLSIINCQPLIDSMMMCSVVHVGNYKIVVSVMSVNNGGHS